MTERYVPNGTPLTPYERELLEILIEECCEVGQAACKLLRFGKENRPPPREDREPGQPNTTILSLEYGDLRAVAGLLISANILQEQWIVEGRRRKLERLKYYMQNEPPGGWSTS